MGYGNWTEITINNRSDHQVGFRKAALEWGKFYSCQPTPSKDHEISLGKVNEQVVNARSSFAIGSCGRENTWSGCEGSFELYDKSTGAHICTVNFCSPHGNSPVVFNITGGDEDWAATQKGFNKDSDVLGLITLTVAKVA